LEDAQECVLTAKMTATT